MNEKNLLPGQSLPAPEPGPNYAPPPYAPVQPHFVAQPMGPPVGQPMGQPYVGQANPAFVQPGAQVVYLQIMGFKIINLYKAHVKETSKKILNPGSINL